MLTRFLGYSKFFNSASRIENGRKLGKRYFSAKVEVGHACPKTMKYMQHDLVKEGNPSLFVATRDTPSYNPEKERLIKVEATAVNRADLLQVGSS